MRKFDYDRALIAWKLSLDDRLVRELAGEWAGGSDDIAALDAAYEAARRWPNGHIAKRMVAQGLIGSLRRRQLFDHAASA